MMMNNESALNPTFWSGVINFIRASANSAEASQGRKFTNIPDTKTVLVFRTTVDTLDGHEDLESGLDRIAGRKNWTIDFDDVDRVLRVVCVATAEESIVNILNEAGYDCEILA